MSTARLDDQFYVPAHRLPSLCDALQESIAAQAEGLGQSLIAFARDFRQDPDQFDRFNRPPVTDLRERFYQSRLQRYQDELGPAMRKLFSLQLLSRQHGKPSTAADETGLIEIEADLAGVIDSWLPAPMNPVLTRGRRIAWRRGFTGELGLQGTELYSGHVATLSRTHIVADGVMAHQGLHGSGHSISGFHIVQLPAIELLPPSLS